MYQLVLEGVDIVDGQMSNTVGLGRVQTVVYIPPFKGTVKISSLDAYPVKYHHDEEGLKETVLKRGKKWRDLMGIHHKEYDGVAAFKLPAGKVRKHNVSTLQWPSNSSADAKPCRSAAES